jgi:hypothetical protein
MYRNKRERNTRKPKSPNHQPQRMITMPATKTTTNVRFDHSKCDHAKSGNEGKKARAKCRKEHAEKAAKAAARASKATTPKPRATRKPAAPKVKETVPAAPAEESTDDLVADL